jgi:hypothetical protein
VARDASRSVGNASIHGLLRRRVNDRVYGIAVKYRIDDPEFLCECAVDGCPAMVRLTHGAYREARESGTAIVAPRHIG